VYELPRPNRRLQAGLFQSAPAKTSEILSNQTFVAFWSASPKLEVNSDLSTEFGYQK
jgi:hypothetical protein